MLFVGLLILAGIGIRNLDVSLLPDLDIPVMIIQVDAPDKSPSEVERQALAPIRRHLLTMNGIVQLATEAKWGQGEIRINFVYGWDMDKAFIETNEKVDLSLNDLSDIISRPRVIKTRAEDLPSYLLTLGFRKDHPNANFLDLSEFAREVLQRRLEQLAEVALVDIHGAEKLQVKIIPDDDRMTSLGLDARNIQQELENQDIPISSIRLKERNYEYTVQLGHPLHSIDRVREIKLVAGDRVLALSDIADVQYTSQPVSGAYVDQGKKAISLAIIKTPDASLDDLKKSLLKIIDQVRNDFPNVALDISRDQTKLLEVTISNLYVSLILGCLLAVGIVFFFYSYWRIPVLIAIVIPVSLLITLLFFKAFSVSINLLSLSGILLGLGLMIDNGIIVLDNISQDWQNGNTLSKACSAGTNEMIRPLLTSLLTTCSVFIPLVFLSGLAGALFWDQALAVSIGVLISYIVSIVLLPTLYFTLLRRKERAAIEQKNLMVHYLEGWYKNSLTFCLNHKKILTLAIILFLAATYPLLKNVVMEQFPELPEEALEIAISWNEPLRPEILSERVSNLLEGIDEPWQAHLGESQYLLNNFYDGDINRSEILLRYQEQSNSDNIRENILEKSRRLYPNAKISFYPEKTAFHMLFPTKTNTLEIHCYLPRNQNSPTNETFKKYLSVLKSKSLNKTAFRTPVLDKSYLLHLDADNMLYYEVDHRVLISELKRLLGQHTIAQITSFQYQLPVVIQGNTTSIWDAINKNAIKNKNGIRIPIKQLVDVKDHKEPRAVFAGSEGAFVPIWVQTNDHTGIEKFANEVASTVPELRVEIMNPTRENQSSIKEILFALLASILMLYFLMAAQFESLVLPMIVLLELPISLAGSIYFLWLFDASINVMSAIGMVVTIGIVINDSIIKIDTIDRMRKSSMSVIEAIHQGGLKRLNPIIMTSLTTVLAVLPFLWGDDLGSMLQRPLALSIIGGMVVGTLVSLFVIPMLYQLTNRNS